MITIDHYTGAWQPALQPTPTAPRINSHVRIPDYPDAREYDDFYVALKRDQRDLEWVRWMPRLKMHVYKVVKVSN